MILSVGASDILSSIYNSEQSNFFCLDLRSDDMIEGSGKIPSELNVEASVWKKELLLEGIIKCLVEIRGVVRI